MELPKAEELTNLVIALAPGLIILAIRARFQVSANTDLKDKVLNFAVASSAYYAGVYPLFHAHIGPQLPSWLWNFLLHFSIPSIVGLGIVYFDQSDSFYKLTKRARLKVSHHIPSAWDYAFSKITKGTYVLIALSDGTQYAGIMGSRSFASSSSGERDLLIEEVWSVQKQGAWMPVEPKRAVLLCGRDVRWVEIFRR